MHTQKHNRDSLLNNYLDILLGWSAHFPLKDRSKDKKTTLREHHVEETIPMRVKRKEA